MTIDDEQHRRPEADDWPSMILDGGTFLFDGPPDVDPIWGQGEQVLWAAGESVMICGPTGVGKTTLVGQLVRGRLGLNAMVLGQPVRPGRRVLYLAMDRPRQIRRALLRIFDPGERETVADGLRVWPGPPPFDLAKFPGLLSNLARKAGADTVIVDSLKDAFLGLTDDEAAASWNRARQTALGDGVELAELHHQTKRGAGGSPPTTLADVYGSTFITAGAGSVIVLWGAAGDPIVQFRHLKQPAAEVGPWQIIHDHDTGISTVHRSADVVRLAALAGTSGLTVRAAAMAIFETNTPTDTEIEKARRRLNDHVAAGRLTMTGGGRTGHAAAYHATAPERGHAGVTRQDQRDGVTGVTRGSRPNTSPQARGVTPGVTGVTAPEGSRSPPSLIEGERTPAPLNCPSCGHPFDSQGHEINCEIRHPEGSR